MSYIDLLLFQVFNSTYEFKNYFYNTTISEACLPLYIRGSLAGELLFDSR